jgi:hypothetical protein
MGKWFSVFRSLRIYPNPSKRIYPLKCSIGYFIPISRDSTGSDKSVSYGIPKTTFTLI